MVQPEGNNWWTRNAYGENKILPDQFNNEYDNNNKPGVQAAIRNIMHSRETAQLLISGTSASFNCTPSGSYSYAGIAPGWILTRDSDSLSRIVAIAQATGLNIDAVTKCIVASNDGTASVKEKTSVLPTDVIIATRGPLDDALVDVRNLKTGDDILNLNLGGNLRVDSLSQVHKIGVDSSDKRCIVLKDGDSLAGAITALNGSGSLILLPGTYGNATISGNVSIVGSGESTVIGTITIGGSGTYNIDNLKFTSIVDSGAGLEVYLTVSRCVSSFGGAMIELDVCTTGNIILENSRFIGTLLITNFTGFLKISSCYIGAVSFTANYAFLSNSYLGVFSNASGTNAFHMTGCMGTSPLEVSTYASVVVSSCTFIMSTYGSTNYVALNLGSNALVSNCYVKTSITYACTTMISANTCTGCDVHYNANGYTCATGITCVVATGNTVVANAGTITEAITASKGKAANSEKGVWTP